MSLYDLDKARAEATHEVCSSVLTAAGDAMKRHGDDPTGGAILAAGFAMALQAIGDKIDPKVPIIVREMLGR
jgi:hypothetical protein